LARAAHNPTPKENTVASRKDQKFETQQDQIGTHKKFEPTYPGEKGLDLDPETIRRLEAEKQAMLASMHVPQYTSTQRPAEEVLTDDTIEDALLAPPLEPVAEGAVEAAKAAVIALQDKHRFESETRELEFKNALAAKLKELGELEIREAKQIDAGSAQRLKDVLTSINESSVADDVFAARENAGTERQQALRRRAAPVLAVAAQERRLLAAFKREYGATLDELRSIPRGEWMIGTPSEGRGAHTASGLYAQLDNSLTAVETGQTLLEQALRTDAVVQREGEVAGGWPAEIERLIKSAARGWDQNDERAWVWAITRLQKVGGVVESLQLMVKGVIGAGARLRDLKSAANVERSSGIAPLPQEKAMTRVSDASWSPLGDAR